MSNSPDEIRAKIEGLEYQLKREPASKLVKYIKRSGTYKGEVVDFTPAQYRQLMNKSPRKAIINKRGKVPWEYMLDELATELGYKSDEALKNAIERSRKLMQRIETLKSQLRTTNSRSPKVLSMKGVCPASIKEKRCKTKWTRVNGVEVTAVRQPSQWRVHVHKLGSDLTGSNEIGTVRYADDAEQVVRQSAKQLREKYYPAKKKPARKPLKKRRK